MKMHGGTKVLGGASIALAALILASAGCGAAGETASDEGVSVAKQALGSPNPTPTDIRDWTGLTTMVSNGNYRLTADINAGGKTWTPKNFTGTFDGNGKRIYDLTINVSGDAGFFSTISTAIVKNVKFTNLKVTGTWMVGGLAGFNQDSVVERIVVEGTVTSNNGFAAGGIFGEMMGGSIDRSYVKGTVNGSLYYIGGLVGFLGAGVDDDHGSISRSYSQSSVSPTTTDTSRLVYAGGIVGGSFAANVHDVYVVGNVTGRGAVGGLVGWLNCTDIMPWALYRGIYRGDVVDKNAPTGGWAGTVGTYTDCIARWENCVWDNQLDPSSNYIVHSVSQAGGDTNTLKANTTPSGGIYGTGDAGYQDPPWNAGNGSQHHVLRSMPGPNPQPQ
jgi:hypothetical protein